MFGTLDMAPPDPILGLTEAFKKDTKPDKINLGVGVYKDAQNKTPVFASVKRAEERLLASESTKDYLPIPGSSEYAAAVQQLVFGADHEIIRSKRVVTAHTPGGTGALRVAGDFLHVKFPGARIWLSEPTWENHVNIFAAAGVEVLRYPYYDAVNKDLKFDALIAALHSIPEGDVVLFHACCHNPCGMDPSPDQWKTFAEIAAQRGFLPFFDFAYQGLADGLEEDAAGPRIFAKTCPEMIVASSFSKNFGLYNERVGALSLVTASADNAQRTVSHVKRSIRANYSNPPSHGAAIVVGVLQDAELRALWEGEVSEMRGRINGMRRLFVETLKAKGVQRDFSFLTRQKGMFSFSGLSLEQVQALREKHALYIVNSGRINVAGMTPGNMDRLCAALADVIGEG